MNPVQVGIVGGTGYTGVELLRLLAQHPQAQIKCITSRGETGKRVSDTFPSLRGAVDLVYTSPETAELDRLDVVFFATPHGVAMEQARALIESGVKVIDLAADFRLRDHEDFSRWYGITHSCPDLLSESVYGLPELNRDRIKTARLIGLPGCYPTSVQIGLLPLMERPDLIDLASLIADCKSGVSGAGRKAEVHTLLAEASDNFKAYGVPGHRHWPEILQGLKDALEKAGASAEQQQNLSLAFVPHLVPMIRGIHSTIYSRLTPKGQSEDIQALYEERFSNEPFVDVLPANSHPETRSVRASNMVRIALHRPPIRAGHQSNLLTVLVVEDNLVKGAAGQAVQVMNLMFNLPETMGLSLVPVSP